MLIVHVHVRVNGDDVEAFKAATLRNARASCREPGVARFDVIQQQDDPTRFVLVEVYRSAEAAAAPGSGALQAMFSVLLHLAGRPFSADEPLKAGPRHCGQSPARHKETAHYATWRDAVAPMMAQPRQGVRYSNVFPEDARW